MISIEAVIIKTNPLPGKQAKDLLIFYKNGVYYFAAGFG
jgi:hypothetical protein